ncbi:hypothetical protein SUGI_0675260 [Cryptomeria japonica]|nr:hypothetical protein SUGI_0675260 [Cryptomeria japonica]
MASTSTSGSKRKNEVMRASTSTSGSKSNNEVMSAFDGITPIASTSTSKHMKKLSYDVFINHRGPDVKYTLASSLYGILTELSFMLKTGATIIPVFYYVDPSDLRWVHQGKGKYAKAFEEYEQKGRYLECFQEWKKGLLITDATLACS